jgi:hypothetical protein
MINFAIAGFIAAIILWFICRSCTFNNHKWVMTKADKNGFHCIKCKNCGREDISNPYDGICG